MPSDRDENSRFQSAIAAHMAEGAAVIRVSDRVILHTNSGWDDLLGYAPGELGGRQISELAAPTSYSPADRFGEIELALDQDGIWRGMSHLVRGDQSRIWCDASVTAFEDPDHGRLWVAVLRDAARRMAEDSRRQAQAEQFRAWFDLSPTATVVVTDNLLVRDVNDAFCALTGRTWRELASEPIEAMVSAADLTVWATFLTQALADQRPSHQARLRLATGTGAHLDVDARVGVVSEPGRERRLAVVTATPPGTPPQSPPRSRGNLAAEPRTGSE